jgi:ribonuclease HII
VAPRRRKKRPTGRKLFAFDRSFERRFIAGADEAGRGCLAGPLVAAAVLFDLERLTLSDRRALARLNDSKQHDEASREALYPLVLRAAAKTSVIVRCVRGIDSRGLHRTNLDALKSALRCVANDETLCLIDGFRVGPFGYEQKAVVDGDTKSAAIAGASILAKVTRDRLMTALALRYPNYLWDRNVGYGTPEHWLRVNEHGMSPHHRRTFVKPRQLSLELDMELPTDVVVDAITPTPAIVPVNEPRDDALSADLPYLPEAR